MAGDKPKDINDLYVEMAKEDPEQFAIDESTRKINELSTGITPESKLDFANLLNEIGELMILSQEQNISSEKIKSNIAAVTLLLKQMNSLGLGTKNKSVEEAGIARKDYFKNPSGADAIKATLEQIEGIIE